MTEAYLHHLFNSRKLGKSFQTTRGEILEVISFGTLNVSSGPDFLEASLRLGERIWAGNIEFHLKSSDWLKHGHQNDKAYNNVIAHFVYEHDAEIYSGEYLLPVIELKDKLESQQLKFDKKFSPKKGSIACRTSISELNIEIVREQMSIALDQRLRRKRDEAIELFHESINDQKIVLLTLIAKSLGGRHNSDAMESLISKVNFQTLHQLGDDFVKQKSYLLGLSGLNDEDSYFDYIKKMYQLQPMSSVQWKTFGMRPGSQPKKKIEQLAAILKKLDTVDYQSSKSEWRDFFDLKEFDVPILGKSYQDLLLINAVVPFLLALSWFKDDDTLKLGAMQLLEQMNPEKNGIIKMWAELGINPINAKDSQALIEMKNKYCNEKKCLFCTVGKNVLGL